MIGNARHVNNFVKHKLYQLIKSNNESATRATLAKLRRGIGKAPGSQPELWDITLEGLPEELLSKGNEPTYGEWATHAALTFYALHQQGKDIKSQCMYKDGASLGKSVRMLIGSDKNKEEAISRRFVASVSADSLEGLCWQLRGIVQLLKAKNIPLDYPLLAMDLYWFQFPDRRDSIRLRWGQDFYRIPMKTEANRQTK